MTQLPAYLKTVAGRFNEQDAAAGSGMAQPPRVSIGGNRFTLIDADGSTEIVETFDKKFGTYLDAVIVDISPAKSRIFYSKTWAPNQDNYEPPDCTSAGSIRPDAWISEPQNDLCSTCEWAKWGSKITVQGKGVPACQEGKKVILYVEDKGFYTLRITPGSFKTWDSYIRDCKSKGHEPQFLVTRIIFASQGVLAFGAVSFVSEALMHESNQPEAIKALMTSGEPARLPAPKQPEPPEPVFPSFSPGPTPPTSAGASPFSNLPPVAEPAVNFPPVQPDGFGGMKPQQKRTRHTKAQMEAGLAQNIKNTEEKLAKGIADMSFVAQRTHMITDPRQAAPPTDNDLAKAIAEAFAVKT
jgi:hypothetical protein